MMNKTSKRIDTVTVKRIIDTNADTSWLGEYSDDAGDFAIVNRGEYAGEFLVDLHCECGHAENEHSESDDYAIGSGGVKCSVCDCEDFDQVIVERGRSYRYFNSASVDDSNSDEDNRTYAQQDYKRVSGLNTGDWHFIGIRAEARIAIPDGNGSATLQTITSGGLWGIESDSENGYFDEVGNEQLADLRNQLHALGFSKRAIAAAFRNVKRKED